MVINTRPYVIYSAVFGNYDNVVKPQKVFKDVDYVLFTDQPVKQNPWRTVHVDWFDTVDEEFRNRRSARHFKALPSLYMPKHKVSIWIDMTHEVHEHPKNIEKEYLQESDIALFRHELRDCVYQEASAVFQYSMDSKDNIDRQTHLYKTHKYPAHNKLWETPGVVRRNSTSMTKVGWMWWEMLCSYSSRDQISLPYILDKLKIKPTTLPGFSGKCSDINNKIIPAVRDHTKDAHIKKMKRKRNSIKPLHELVTSGFAIPINSIRV